MEIEGYLNNLHAETMCIVYVVLKNISFVPSSIRHLNQVISIKKIKDY